MVKNVFVAFANSLQSPLPFLTQEDDQLASLLMGDGRTNGYALIRESNATAHAINQRFKEFDGQIAVFHYSGHAGNKALLFNDIAVIADGLAAMLGKSANNGSLKLVVLNGCSTKEQVKLLLDLGVPAVIATHAPVEDRCAFEFSVRFYQYLVEGGMNIKSAFNTAINYAQNTTGQDLHIIGKQPRGIDYLKEIKDDAKLWELFFRDETDIKINPLPKNPLLQPATDNGSVNKHLRETIYNALLNAKNRNIVDLNEKELRKIYIENQDIDECIVSVLPMPIGEHIRKLFCKTEAGAPDGYDKISVKRIEQICRVYYTTMELLSCVCLSQLWEYKIDGNLPEDLVKTLKNHFSLSAEEREKYNYEPFLMSILSFLDEQPGHVFFIIELQGILKLLTTDKIFKDSCNYLTNLKLRVIDRDILENDVADLCWKAEDWVSNIFSHLGFLHQYQLTSIQAISILKYRYSNKYSYTHSVIKLMRVGGSEKFLYQLNNCLSCQGVVLIKGELAVIDNQRRIFVPIQDLEFLNLSPFLIDVWAFETAGKSKIVIFEEYVELTDKYRYKDVCKPDSLRDVEEVDQTNKYQSVKLEMDYYRIQILGTPLHILQS